MVRFVAVGRAEAHHEHGANEILHPPDVDGSQLGTKFHSELRDRGPLQFLKSRPGARMPSNQMLEILKSHAAIVQKPLIEMGGFAIGPR